MFPAFVLRCSLNIETEESFKERSISERPCANDREAEPRLFGNVRLLFVQCFEKRVAIGRGGEGGRGLQLMGGELVDTVARLMSGVVGQDTQFHGMTNEIVCKIVCMKLLSYYQEVYRTMTCINSSILSSSYFPIKSNSYSIYIACATAKIKRHP